MKKIIPFVLGVFCLSGCSSPSARSLSQQAVAEFHQRYNEHDYAGIARMFTPAYAHLLSLEALSKKLDAIHLKYGHEVTCRESSARVMDTIMHISRIELTEQTTFAGGTTEERFNFEVTRGKVQLNGYEISLLNY